MRSESDVFNESVVGEVRNVVGKKISPTFENITYPMRLKYPARHPPSVPRRRTRSPDQSVPQHSSVWSRLPREVISAPRSRLERFDRSERRLRLFCCTCV